MSKGDQADLRTRTVRLIKEAVDRFPTSISVAKKEDTIWTVLQRKDRDASAYENFVKGFDVLFGEDCRDQNGRFPAMRRGRYGMSNVVAYLGRIVEDSSMLHEPVMLKLERLEKEVRFLAGYAAVASLYRMKTELILGQTF